MRGRVTNPAAQRLDWSAEPSPDRWAGLMRDRWNATRHDPRALRFRAQLGLAVDRPVVMTGHQPVLFHPGVLAKYIAASALAQRHDAHASFLVVDQDEVDPGAIEIPEKRTENRLARGTVRVLDAAPEGVAAGCSPAQQTLPLGEADLDWPFVRTGLEQIHDAISARTNAASLAEQSSLASFDLMRPLGIFGDPVLATRLSRTDLFRQIVDRMRADPLAFVEQYAYPEARITPLLMSLAADRFELPLWSLAPNTPRRRVYEEELDCSRLDTLAPRALLMTLLVRLAGCDLFIHGAGGLVYDRITERLAREWLGEELAPMTLATATVTLPLLDSPPPDDAAVARAVWLAHHARHDPAMLNDQPAAQRKALALRAIASLPHGSPERAAAFREMHEALASSRAEHAAQLDRFRTAARETRAARESAAIANERAWAFPLYPQSTLEALCQRINQRFA